MHIMRYYSSDIDTLYGKREIIQVGLASKSRAFLWLAAEGEVREWSFLWLRKKQTSLL